MKNYTFLFLQQFKTVDTKTQICSELGAVGFAAEHVGLVLVPDSSLCTTAFINRFLMLLPQTVHSHYKNLCN